MPANFGILQPIEGPKTQIVSVPNTQLQNEQGLLQGIGMLNDTLYKNQQLGIEKTRLGMEQQKLPGELAQQKATLGETNARTGLLSTQGKEEQINLLKAQRDQQFQQSADTAFAQAKKQGLSNEQALDAYQANLSPEASITMQTTRDSHKAMIATNNTTQLGNAAGITNAVISEYQKTNDPKEQQHILDNANRQLDRVDPDHPKITNFQDLHDYGVATMGTLMNPRVQAQLQFELQKAKVQADTKSNADITTKSVEDANTNAAGAQQELSTQSAYDSKLQQIQQWNQTHPNAQITTGPGSSGWLAAKQRAAAAGFPVKDLDTMEQLEGLHNNLVASSLTSLKTIPRNERVVNAFTSGLSNPTDTMGAQQVKSQIIRYNAQNKISYSDFLKEYKDANGNSVTGAERQWSKFVNADPSLSNNGLPDPKYIANSDEYLKYTNKNYTPSKTEQSTNQQFQEGKVYQDAKGNKATYSNGKWIEVQ